MQCNARHGQAQMWKTRLEAKKYTEHRLHTLCLARMLLNCCSRCAILFSWEMICISSRFTIRVVGVSRGYVAIRNTVAHTVVTCYLVPHCARKSYATGYFPLLIFFLEM